MPSLVAYAPPHEIVKADTKESGTVTNSRPVNTWIKKYSSILAGPVSISRRICIGTTLEDGIVRIS